MIFLREIITINNICLFFLIYASKISIDKMFYKNIFATFAPNFLLGLPFVPGTITKIISNLLQFEFKCLTLRCFRIINLSALHTRL